MPNLKCIGGPHDGEIVKIDADQREAVMWKSRPTGTSLARHGINGVSAIVDHTRYTRRGFYFGDAWIEFLACESDTNEAALRFVLEP